MSRKNPDADDLDPRLMKEIMSLGEGYGIPKELTRKALNFEKSLGKKNNTTKAKAAPEAKAAKKPRAKAAPEAKAAKKPRAKAAPEAKALPKAKATAKKPGAKDVIKRWRECSSPAMWNKQEIDRPEQIYLMLYDVLACKKEENVYVVGLDKKRRFLFFQQVGLGKRGVASFSVRSIFAKSLATGTRSLIMAHNHPGGENTLPSDADRMAERFLRTVARVFDILLLDSVIMNQFGFSSTRNRRYSNEYYTEWNYPIEPILSFFKGRT